MQIPWDGKAKQLSLTAAQLSAIADLLIKTIWTKPLAPKDNPFVNQFITKKIVITLTDPSAPATPASKDANAAAPAPAPVMVTPSPRTQTTSNQLTIKFIGLYPPGTVIGSAPIPMPCDPVEAPKGPIPAPTGPIPPPTGPIPLPGGQIPIPQVPSVPPSGVGILNPPRSVNLIAPSAQIPMPTAPIPLAANPKP